MTSLLDPCDLPESTPCTDCHVAIGRKVEWTRDGARVVLCRGCYYIARAEGTDVDNLFRAAGFTIWDTAGGCNGYARGDESEYVLITLAEDAEAPESITDMCAVGHYRDGDCVEVYEPLPVPLAIAKAFQIFP